MDHRESRTVDLRQAESRGFEYWKKGDEPSFNLAKREVPNREGESITVGSRGLWIVDLTQAQIQESEEGRQEIFSQREVRSREALERLALGHSEGSH